MIVEKDTKRIVAVIPVATLRKCQGLLRGL